MIIAMFGLYRDIEVGKTRYESVSSANWEFCLRCFRWIYQEGLGTPSLFQGGWAVQIRSNMDKLIGDLTQLAEDLEQYVADEDASADEVEEMPDIAFHRGRALAYGIAAARLRQIIDEVPQHTAVLPQKGDL